jgi:hypothetical protein
MDTTTASPLTVNTKDEVFFKEMGLRIAQARKERNITQVQLCAKQRFVMDMLDTVLAQASSR